MQYHNVSERKVGGRRAPKLCRLDGFGTTSRIVHSKIGAGAHLKVIEVVEKIADVP
jgi:hypothetical protein